MLKRAISPLTWLLLQKRYGTLVNEKNIQKLSFWKIRQVFQREDKNLKEIYLHNVIWKWVEKDTFIHPEKKFQQVKKVLRKSRITLNENEKEWLFLLEERSFSAGRNIKSIDVNFNLEKKEYVHTKYVRAHLFTLEANQRLKLVEHAKELLVSNNRFIFNKKLFFNFSNVKWFEFATWGFVFCYENSKTYVLQIYDAETLNNTLLNFFSKKNKRFLEKEKKLQELA